MREYKKIDRWIDLDKLPKTQSGRVKWADSCGMRVPFKYENTIGEVEILEYVGKHKYNIAVYVGDKVKKYCMSSSLISACDFGGVLRQSVGETNPNLIKYFVNTKDAFKYSAYSTKPVDMVCPFCGFKKKQSVELLMLGGFSCPRCSDGISFANKLMFNVLMQLNVHFKNEITKKDSGFEWVDDYRYDFYVKLTDCNLLIEMDGHFHDGSNFNTYDNAHAVDIEKDTLALNNGFNIIRIDCRYPKSSLRFEYIKQNILESQLCDLLDMSHVNWSDANEYALGSYVKQAADLFNSGITSVVQIAQQLGVCRSTARTYLKLAAEGNLCSYAIVNGQSLVHIKPVALYKDGLLVGVFISAYELDRNSEQIFGVHMDYRTINAICNKKRRAKRVRGYTPTYIAYEEYERILPQFNQQYKINLDDLQGVS